MRLEGADAIQLHHRTILFADYAGYDPTTYRLTADCSNQMS